jgi:replicative DNA helicase
MTHEQRAIGALHALEAETSVLGCLLLDNSSWDRLGDKLKPEHFYDETNRLIFTEISRQLSAAKNCDVITVATALGDHATFAELNVIAQYVPSAANLRRYADLVIERYKSRQLMSVSGELMELAGDHSSPIEDRVDQAQSQLLKLIDDAPRDEWVGAFESMTLHTQVLEDRAEGKIVAWPTGLYDIDEFLEGGMRPGELYILGARPSMGKTALAMTIGLNMAANYSVGVMSMEMAHVDVNDRKIAMLGRVSLSTVKRPNKGGGLDWDRVLDGIERSRDLNFYVSDQGGLNINQVRAKARNLKRVHGLNVLIIDYIGLMSGLDAKANRNTQLGEISRGLKALAKELQISILCLAQLNRKAEDRPDSMPQMSDLRDSGEIEQDADVIIFVKRPIHAQPDLGPEWQNYAQIGIPKNRQGRVGTLSLTYIGEQTRFDSWSGQVPQKSAAIGKTKGNF